MRRPTPPPNRIIKDHEPPLVPAVMLLIAAIMASALVSRGACAEILRDPALVCAAARTKQGAWLDLAGLKRCIASEKLRAIDATEIESLRAAFKVQAEALQAAEARALEAQERRWYYFGGGAAVGLLVTVLIVGAAR